MASIELLSRSDSAIIEAMSVATDAVPQGLSTGAAAGLIVRSAQGAQPVTSPTTTVSLETSGNTLTIFGAADYASIGTTVVSAGDFNHDGIEDFLINGQVTDAELGGRGVTYLIYGREGGLGTIDLNHLTTDQGFAIYGPGGSGGIDTIAASAGDVNGDGVDDLIIGLPRSSEVYVLYGHAGVSGTVNLGAITTLQGAAISMNPQAPGSNLGMFLGGSVAGAGDVNGDGVDDVIIGAESDGSVAVNGGRAFVLYGSTNGLGNINLATLTPQQGFALQGTQSTGFAGHVVTGLGDINGDGIDDLAVSVPFKDSVYVYYGKAGGLTSTTLGPIAASDGFIIQGAQYAGYSLAAAGDVNGDGYQDIVLGTGTILYGADSYVVFGKAGAIGTIDLAHLTASQGFIIHSNGGPDGDRAGASVAGAGDVNGDGFDDVVIGVANNDAHGSGYVVFGSATAGDVTLGGSNTLQITGGSVGDNLGRTIGEADVDGDGYSDVLLGAGHSQGGGYFRGAAYVTYSPEATAAVNRTGTVASQTLAGGAGDDILNGVGGDDRLYGNAGHDVLNGGSGNDYLNGGSGADDLTGGTGDDRYVVDSAADVVHELAGEGTDTILASLNVSLGDYANVENLVLSGTADLTGTGDNGNNVITANRGNDHLMGLGGSDTLIGNDGADALDGGEGADLMAGGAGDDIYYVDNSLDMVVEKAGGGTDTVIASIDHYMLADQVENLTLAGTSLDGTGNALANVITGNDFGNHLLGLAGADTLIGNGGADILDGGAGGDAMAGGIGDDVYYVDDALDTVVEKAGEGTDTVIASIDYTLGAELENLSLNPLSSALNGSGTGNALANVITGNDGNNRLTGLDGADTLVDNNGNDILDGGAGADSMAGGAGNDIYYVDNALDTVLEKPGDGTDIVIASVSYAITAGSEIETLETANAGGIVAIDLTGNAFANTLIGNAGANHLDGGGGADKLYGAAGDDIYRVDNVGDQVFENLGEGNDQIQTSISYTLAAGQSIETLATTDAFGTDAIDLTGNGLANHLIGNAGANRLDGGAGADLMEGGAGNDSYLINNPGDVVVEAVGGGTDTILTSIDYALTAGLEIEHLAALDPLATAALNLTGNELANIIDGNAGANTLTGGAGDDVINALGGNDHVFGGDGNDNLSGGDGNDLIDGGAGADNIYGGLGDDVSYADRADDLVFENAGEGTDTVVTTAGYYLYANIENLTLATGAGDIFGVGNELANTITGNEGSNLLIAGAGDDVVHGGSGVDSLFGQDGNDHLFGDAGIDYLVGGNGDDVIDGGADADALYGEDGNDTLYGGTDFQTDILVGGNGNDVLHGDSGLGDYDLMDGGAGNDSYYVDTPADLTFEAVGGGTDTVYANINGAGYYLYANVENLVLQGTTPYGVGNDLDNHLTGNGVSNYLLGGAGNDVLNGKGGNDVLFGESGADTFVFEHGTGGDVIGDFTAGTDKIDLSAFGFANYQTVVNSMHEVNGTTAIDLGGGDFVVLNGVAEVSLNASDFILVAPAAQAGISLARAVQAADATGASSAMAAHQFHALPIYDEVHNLLF
jgi:Ca2+-binding RTX toxin-like protein